MPAPASRLKNFGLVAALGLGCGDPRQVDDSTSLTTTPASEDLTDPAATTATATTGEPTSATSPPLDTTTEPGEATTRASDGAGSSTGTTDGPVGSDGSTTEAPLPPPPCPEATFCADATADGACRRTLTLPDGNLFHYWSNLSLEPELADAGCNAEVDRVAIVQHGTNRNAWSYFNTIVEAATSAGVADHTLIVAPWFPAEVDAPEPGVARWNPGGSGWKSGDVSTTDPPVSSFTVYDHILAALVLDPGVHPQVADVVITGHSAGGQFVQRYAVASDLGGGDETAASLRWIVANPSSYLYLDPFRWDQQGTPPLVDFEIPMGTSCDATYDDFKYGLSNIPAGHYVAQHLAEIPTRYLGRDVTYLLGEEDIQLDDDLDTACPATLQGLHRLERGLVFTGFLDARHPTHIHETVTVPGADHSHSKMYKSAEGLAALFP